MRSKIVLVAAVAVGVLSMLAGTATAAPATGSGPVDTSCTDVRLPGTLPVPPVGMSAQQDVTIGADCVPHMGPVRFVPAPTRPAPRAMSAMGAEAPVGRQVQSWSEMYDCCKILMTGLYTTSTWDTADNQVTNAVTTVRHAANREPWNAGWSVKASNKTETEAGSRITAHAEFGYKGIFDITGNWYANTHDTSVRLNGDGTASCQFDITLRHTFIGWNSVRGCS